MPFAPSRHEISAVPLEPVLGVLLGWAELLGYGQQ